jgi:hypothetical protein
MSDALILAQYGSNGAPSAAIFTIVGVTVVYLLVIRFMDLNEKEPFRGIALLFGLGAAAGLALPYVADTPTLELNRVLGPLLVELSKFGALAIGLALLGAAGRRRGWAEMGGLMDGIVYGAAVGFGFAAGAAIFRELTFRSETLTSLNSPITFAAIALFGLSEGLFGAVMGAGFGAAVTGSKFGRGFAVTAGLGLAILFHIVFAIVARGNALAGSAGYTRHVLALAIPVVFVIGVVVVALTRERRALRENLADEAEAGVVTRDEFELLGKFVARRALYLRRFLSGDLAGWRAQRALHNRQIQLALAEARLSRESDPDRRSRIGEEVSRLRQAIGDARTRLLEVGG